MSTDDQNAEKARVKEELKSGGEGKDEIKAVKRQITNVYTKGTCSNATELTMNEIEQKEEDAEETGEKRIALFESKIYSLFFCMSSYICESR